MEAAGTKPAAPAPHKARTRPEFDRLRRDCVTRMGVPMPLPPPDEPPGRILDLFRQDSVWEDPESTVLMTEDAYKRALAVNYRWALVCVKQFPSTGNEPFPVPKTLPEMLFNRATTTEACRTREATSECGNCGGVHGIGWPQTKCGSMLCPACAPVLGRIWTRSIDTWVKKHPPRPGPPAMFHSSATISPPKISGLSVLRLRFDRHRILRSLDVLWQRRFKKAGLSVGTEHGPGLLAMVECSKRGAVHLHLWRYGAYVDDRDAVDVLRAYEDPSLGANSVQSRVGWSHEHGDENAAAQHQGYAEKGSKQEDVGDDAGRYMHPLLVVLAEIAFFRQRRHIAKGSMRAARSDLERTEAALAKSSGHDLCMSCGSGNVEVTVTKKRPHRISSLQREAALNAYVHSVEQMAARAGIRPIQFRRDR